MAAVAANDSFANGCLPLLAGIVPLIGLLTELGLGCLSGLLPMFPTPWHALAVGLAVLINAALHVGRLRAHRFLVLRASLIGFVLGMASLYAIVQIPALPVIAITFAFVIGLLASAPYLVLFGMTKLIPQLERDWQATGRPRGQLYALLLAMASAPLAATAWSAWQQRSVATTMVRLVDAMKDHATAEEERLAAKLRGAGLDQQRSIAAVGQRRRGWIDKASWFEERQPGWHIGDGRAFWFVRAFAAVDLDRQSARTAYHRAHGTTWDRGAVEWPGLTGRSRHYLTWKDSRIKVTVEPAAAIAEVDWTLEVASSHPRRDEARFDLRLPPGAVASALSLWIDGTERPAAFASADRVQAAYDSVVRRARDPALLQEVAPGRLRLLLFPLSRSLPPMRVRLGITVPLVCRGDETMLWLPQIIDHNCAAGRVDQHRVELDAGATHSRDRLTDAELRRVIRLPRSQAIATATDADGIIVQSLAPHSATANPADRAIVVLEASSTFAERCPDANRLLSALPRGTACSLFIAHGSDVHRIDAPVGSEALTRAVDQVDFAGGVDARPALAQAVRTAVEAGQPRIYWLHGAMGSRHFRSWPALRDDVEIAALTVHPGRHVLREQPEYDRHVIDIPSHGSEPDALVTAFEEFVRFGPTPEGISGDRVRRFTRPESAPDGAVDVSDQIARLWAAIEARALRAAGRRDEARRLAARYRLVTAGVGAVVLESPEQYGAHGLDPGAPIGREPAGAIGAGPVPEPSTLWLLATGLLLLATMAKRRVRVGKPAA